MIDLSNPSGWNLVFRRDLSKGSNRRIPRQSFTTAANRVFVGISVPDEPTWYRGGYLTQYIAALPSTTADLFTALTQVANFRLTCRNYQVISLVSVLPLPSIVAIDLPVYFTECKLEIYAHDDP